MRYVLENECLKVEIDSFGAEIKSVYGKNNHTEYMWCGDKKYWGRTSPVLFPFVGSLKNKEYIYEGKAYAMGQHGFARDMEHELVSKDETEIEFKLCANEETKEKYPFDFALFISYELDGNKVSVHWKVVNQDEKTMYFSIGAHPAFNCPLDPKDDKYGYSLYFGGTEKIIHHGNTLDTGLALREKLVLPLEHHKAVITPGFFDRCTYMIEGKQTQEVGLVDKKGNRYVTMYFDAPLFAIWSPEGKNAPFVCIEPWYGRCDATDFEGELKDREYTNILQPGRKFEAGYEIDFDNE